MAFREVKGIAFGIGAIAVGLGQAKTFDTRIIETVSQVLCVT